MSHQTPVTEHLVSTMESLGSHVMKTFLDLRSVLTSSELATVSHQSLADTIYTIDRKIEESIIRWLLAQWPADFPVQLVMEGQDEVTVFPSGQPPRGLLIIDPIDGTREIMWDRRSAWFLAGLAPLRNQVEPNLQDIEAAVMVELPPTRHRGAHRIRAERGKGVHATFVDFVAGETFAPLAGPYRGASLEHGYAGIFSPGPEAKGAMGRFVERLFAAYEGKSLHALSIFDDQYTSTGGQFFDLMTGRLRLYGDLRPQFIEPRTSGTPFVCHPYDVCTALIAKEMGCVIEHPTGGALKQPLDTTSPVSWMGYANETIAERARPIVQKLLAR